MHFYELIVIETAGNVLEVRKECRCRGTIGREQADFIFSFKQRSYHDMIGYFRLPS